MYFNLFGVRVKISFMLIATVTLFSFFDREGLFLMALFSAFLHELGHIFATYFCGVEIKELSFSLIGIKMRLKKSLSLVPFSKKIMLLIAGPLVNVILAMIFLAFSLKVYALINLVTAIFNLLPAKTLDGGKILLDILNLKLAPNTAETVSDIVSLVVSALLFILGAIVLCVSGYNISLVATSIYLAITVIIRQKRLN